MSAGLKGTVDVLAYIDKAVDNVQTFGEPASLVWRNDEVLELLADIRDGLTADPDWSAVVEGNLRADLKYERDNAEAAVVIFEMSLRHVEGERDRARALAVRLEQECAELRTGAGRRTF